MSISSSQQKQSFPAINSDFREIESCKTLTDLRRVEDFHLRKLNNCEQDLYELSKELTSLQITLQRNQIHSKLLKTNIFQVFKIRFDTAIPLINNIRVGRLPHERVEWKEINAGIGQIALLVDALSGALNFTFSKYKITPLGNFSTIQKSNERQNLHYELLFLF